LDKSWQSRSAKSPAGPVTPSRGKLLQRKCACGGQASQSEGECDDCKKKKTLQRQAAGPAAAATPPPIVHEVLNSSGQPLDPATRNFFEPRFGHDFSRVRVHTDDRAAESARAVNAAAYTVGSDIVFDSNRYRPADNEGTRLIAHELTHVVQQEGVSYSLLSDPTGLRVAPSDDAPEQAAGKAAMTLGPTEPTAPAMPAVRRAPRTPGSDLEHGSTLPYAQANALSDCIAIMGDQSREYCWEQVKHADVRDLQPISPYRRALGTIRSLDPLMFGFLSKAPMNGASTTIRLVNAVDNSVSPPVPFQIVFNLQVKEVALSPQLDADFDGGVPAFSTTGPKTFTANMVMQINSNSSTDLAQNLYHEGVHMLLFMDDLLPGGSPHGAALTNYKTIAAAHPDFAQMNSQLATMFATKLKLTQPQAQKKAADLVNDVLEEKYVRDQEAAKFKASFTNRALASTQILKDLNDVGISVPITDVAFQSIAQAAARIMDDIDQKVKAAQTPAPPVQAPQGKPQGTKKP
jgi:hypothetical protein